MIEVIVRSSRKELARIKIENMQDVSTYMSDYTVQFAVDNGDGELAMYQRSIYGFPRKKLNVLALLRLALSNLDEKELTLDGDPDSQRPGPADLGRQLGRSLWPF